jgi:5-methyltetrahydrofolate--homocysteine methyltransferase
MRGRFPDILHNPTTGEAARRLYEDAQAMLDRIVEEKWLRAAGVFGLFPANQVDGRRPRGLHRRVPRRGAHRAAPAAAADRGRDGSRAQVAGGLRRARRRPGCATTSGAFAVTAGLGSTERVLAFKKANDDYNAILLESLADRLAEAFAERLHERVRKEFWATRPTSTSDSDGLISEKYHGIRPAPGYPACPEHTEKQTIWELLDVETTAGIELTESMAMWPGAAVSGLYFSHPESRYFVLGRVGRDQVEDYARRKGWTVDEAERWLSPNLGYRTEDE